MRRRAFLTVLGVTGYGGLGWLLEGCSEGTQPNRLGNELPPAATGTGTAPTRPTPTDDDEYVPGPATTPPTVVPAQTLPNPAWDARVKTLESGALYTETAPGPWAGKERSHVPTVVQDSQIKDRVTVLVNHVMQVASTVYPEAGPDTGPVVIDAAVDALDDAADAAPPPPKPPTGPTLVPEHFVAAIYVKTDTGVVCGFIEMTSKDPAPPSVTFTVPPGTKSVTAYEFCNIHGLWASKPLTLK